MMGYGSTASAEGIRGNGDMNTKVSVAGLLTIIGAIALAVAPALGVPSTVQTATPDTVAVAITSGPQLRLTLAGEKTPGEPPVLVSERSMVCGDVYRLAIADIGLHCRAATSTLASAN